MHKNPAVQGMQADEDVLPLEGLNVPAAQGVQADEDVLPLEGLNDPA